MPRTDPTPVPDESHDPVARARVEVAGHELTLFEDSPLLVAAMVEDILAAKSRVWMESYIFAGDSAGRAVADALADRARAGLDVRLMVDAWGSFSMPAAMIRRLRTAGAKVHVFHALGDALYGRLKFLRVLNQRNHRKLLIVDDRIAYFGGMNVVDQCVIHTPADAKSHHLPAQAGWRDVHVRMVGPRQAEVAASCERLWRRVHRQPNGRQARWPVKEMLQSPSDSLFFFDSRPTFKYRRPQRILVPLIRQARREVTLSVAYFLPIGQVFRELLRARRRRVRVRVIVPGHSDVKIVQWACRHYYEFLLKRGIRIYERKDRMLHTKAMIVDGQWSVIGSCNLDARSLFLNLEFFAVFHSPQVAQALEQICQEDIRNSVRVNAAYCERRSWWQRLRDRSAWALRRWL